MGGEESKEKLLAGKGRREKGQREERKVEECVLLSLQPVLSHEGLHSVIISCYGNKIFSFF